MANRAASRLTRLGVDSASLFDEDAYFADRWNDDDDDGGASAAGRPETPAAASEVGPSKQCSPRARALHMQPQQPPLPPPRHAPSGYLCVGVYNMLVPCALI
jgi:hypothetical protein